MITNYRERETRRERQERKRKKKQGSIREYYTSKKSYIVIYYIKWANERERVREKEISSVQSV